MSTTSLPLPKGKTPNLRPLNILRDLPQIADLVELCFKNLDHEGRHYVRQMRKDSQNPRWLSWASTSLPLKGFVWEEDKKIVGNISIVHFREKKEKHILLANVAVHPDYRRRGIARLLTEKAVQHARKLRPNSIWVHVDQNNQGAVKLYRSLGFKSRAVRTTWEAPTQVPPQQVKNKIVPLKSAPQQWEAEKHYLAQTYPPEITWYRMPNFNILAPGFKNWLHRFFMDIDLRHWVMEHNGDFQAALIWIKRRSKRAPVWLATAPQTEDSTLSAILLHARLHLAARNRKVYINYPAEEREDAFKKAGFTPRRTLIWMQTTTKPVKPRIS